MRRNKVDDVIKKITSYSAAEILTLNLFQHAKLLAPARQVS